MSNFLFLTDEFRAIGQEAQEAEQLTLLSPKAASVLIRSAMEKAVRWMFDNDYDLEYPYDRNLSSLIHLPDFREVISERRFRELNLIRKTGNLGAHGNSVKKDDALMVLRYLHSFLGWVARSYAEGDEVAVPAFDEALLPTGNEAKESERQVRELEEQLRKFMEQADAERKAHEKLQAENATLRTEIKTERQTVTARRTERHKAAPFPTTTPGISEAQTRQYYIDVFLKEAGWSDLEDGHGKEYPVVGMPTSTNPSGNGYVDYVLWGRDGKPLAVVEAKKTMVEARAGKHQAKLYADCLETMHGQRPVIFYSNGFETFLWDDTFYPEREVYGFFREDELQRMVDRRVNRKDLRTFEVDRDISGRPYQLEAIQRVAETFVKEREGQLRGGQRDCLMVMATGSGKTRTSAAIVDMLTKCNWAKRVLFLADRTSLVKQAKSAFNEHLPELSAIDLTKEKEDPSTRLVFSTYPTMINKIDGAKVDGERMYGAGHFDLIIIDEAHRSVYQKYRAIFEYFDALLIGLTATPKTEIDRNTYGLFGIEDDNPTFAYELDMAVNQGYLVPPVAYSVPLKFNREGIKYSELSEREKEEYEEKFGDPTTEEAPEEIGSGALNKWLFNTDTVDKVLEHLMSDGIKVAGGDRIGKTIIFAKNHQHALFIEERFNKNYPEYGGSFLRVIDNYESKAQDLLDQFKKPHEEVDPQIAVSVDMMDTGVDAVRVVNLVFFKLVRSSSKFWQMIGRGTRLCPDLFGPGRDKTEFLIFDYCQNFEFFDLHPDGTGGKVGKPLLQRIFQSKLELSMALSGLQDATDEDKATRDQYIDELHAVVAGLDENRIVVRKELEYVKKYQPKAKWLGMTESTAREISKHLSHLQAAPRDGQEMARRFDLLILQLQLAHISKDSKQKKFIGKVASTAVALQVKENIPQVAAQMPLIRSVQTETYWKEVNVARLEELRASMRELIQYLESESQEIVYTSFEDELDKDAIVVREPMQGYLNLQSYKDRVEKYVRENRHHLTIDKLTRNQPITPAELGALEEILFTDDVAGSREQLQQEFGEVPLGKFVRSILGLDVQAAQAAFADFLKSGTFTADQMRFIDTIITYLTKNGTIDKAMLFEPPFTDQSDQGIMGIFTTDAEVHSIIRIIDRINANAEVA